MIVPEFSIVELTEQGAVVPSSQAVNTLPTLSDLPKELGVLLASVGVLGIVLPGIAGAPALLAGGLVLWPKTFGKVESWFQGRFPDTHRKSMQQVGRFLVDLDQRYPHSDPSRSEHESTPPLIPENSEWKRR